MDTDDDARPGGLAGVLLSGGTGARMGGVDKAALQLAGRPLLAWALDALAEADEVVVVGPPAATQRPVTFVREEPPSGGPLAGLLAGRDALVSEPSLLAVLAVDMPRVGPATFRRLRAAAAGRDGALLVDAEGRRQLCGVLVPHRLDAVRPADPGGGSVHRVLARLDLAEVAAEADEARDVDSWQDLRDLG